MFFPSFYLVKYRDATELNPKSSLSEILTLGKKTSQPTIIYFCFSELFDYYNEASLEEVQQIELAILLREQEKLSNEVNRNFNLNIN